MYCLACGSTLDLLKISESGNQATVNRECISCHKKWELTYRDDVLILVVMEGEEVPEDFGFDYTCPKCNFKSYVSTSLQPIWGWMCINCGERVPMASIKPRGGYELPPERAHYSRSTSAKSPRGERKPREPRESGYQRAPRTSKPLPEGAVSIRDVAERLNVEPKKLRSWLRKVSWRTSEEAGSGWVFSPGEVEEIVSKYGK